jgi:hypothetical protein
MALSIDTRREVQFTLARWSKESAMHFCRLAQRGAQFTNVVYPTGLKMVVADVNGERAEVPLHQAKKLRAAGFRMAA